MAKREEITNQLVLDEHLYTPREIYDKLKMFQRKHIYLNRPQRDFIDKFEGKTEARRPYND